MRSGQKRPGFTLFEMLVAMALTLFIMVIIAQAFTSALDTFRGMKGIGDMQESLRLAGDRLRADFTADHFEAKRRLSDGKFWSIGKPRRGFFRIYQGTQGTSEGLDPDDLPSFRAVDHRLHFSVKLRGNRPGDFFTGIIPITFNKTGLGLVQVWQNSPFNPDPNNPAKKPSTYFDQPYDALYQQVNSYNSQWAEIAYFLERTDETSPGGTPLYSLYRVQRLVIPKTSDVNGIVDARCLEAYGEFSAEADSGGKLHFHTPEDLANGHRGFVYNSSRKLGASLLMTHVVSFQVSVLKRQFNALTVDVDFTDFGPNYPATFDTASGIAAQQQYTIRAIRIVMRVWDEATAQARQVTVIQDL